MSADPTRSVRANLFRLREDHAVIPEPDIQAWEDFMVWENRCIGYVEMSNGVCVSTVFFGIDESFYEGGAPRYFGTLIWRTRGARRAFQGLSEYTYATWAEALAGHLRALDRVIAELPHLVSPISKPKAEEAEHDQ